MIDVILALAALAPLPPAPERVTEEPCRKVEHVPKAATNVPKSHRPKPIKHRYRPKRLFKSEPKIVEDDCNELPPAPYFPLPEEPDAPSTPVPFVTLEPPEVPVQPVPGVDTPEPACECFGGEPGLPVYQPSLIPSVAAWPGSVVSLAPIPEPGSWALMMVGLLFLARKARPDKPTGALK